MWKFLEPFGQSTDCLGILGDDLCITLYLVCMRPEMAMDFELTKWDRDWVSGLPMDNPLFYFGTVKNSLGFM